MKKMKLPTVEKHPTGWSYSAWGMFSKCMFLYYCVRILGLKEGSNRFMERGIELHKYGEQYLKGGISKLPTSFDSLRSEYAALKKASPIVEQFWGVSNKWQPSNYGSWAVMKMDAAVPPSKITDNMLFIQDLKSGKESPTHIEQGELYGAIGTCLYPKADGVEASFWYVDQGITITHTFDLTAIKHARKMWTERGNEMLSKRKKWPKSPSPWGCKYCFLRSDKGGPCEDWREYG